MLAVRSDGEKVRQRIIYMGAPFVAGTDKGGSAKKPGKTSISYEHLPAKRVSFGHPAGGISLAVQKASWCHSVQSDRWVTEDFMRRPGTTAFRQARSILVLGDFKCHKDAAFQDNLKRLAKTDTELVGGGLTPIVQPLDRTVNKEFKRGMRAEYTVWVKDEFGGEGKEIKAPNRGLVATWVKKVWEGITAETIRSCFKVCGLSLNLDGSEDNTRGAPAPSATTTARYWSLVEQREAWETAHGIELEPLQLPVTPKAPLTRPTRYRRQSSTSKVLLGPKTLPTARTRKMASRTTSLTWGRKTKWAQRTPCRLEEGKKNRRP